MLSNQTHCPNIFLSFLIIFWIQLLKNFPGQNLLLLLAEHAGVKVIGSHRDK